MDAQAAPLVVIRGRVKPAMVIYTPTGVPAVPGRAETPAGVPVVPIQHVTQFAAPTGVA
jgi:hypothetical protein